MEFLLHLIRNFIVTFREIIIVLVMNCLWVVKKLLVEVSIVHETVYMSLSSFEICLHDPVDGFEVALSVHLFNYLVVLPVNLCRFCLVFLVQFLLKIVLALHLYAYIVRGRGYNH